MQIPVYLYIKTQGVTFRGLLLFIFIYHRALWLFFYAQKYGGEQNGR